MNYFEAKYADMTVSNLEVELQGLNMYFAACAEIGQGINTKEVIQKRVLENELAKRRGE